MHSKYWYYTKEDFTCFIFILIWRDIQRILRLRGYVTSFSFEAWFTSTSSSLHTSSSIFATSMTDTSSYKDKIEFASYQRKIILKSSPKFISIKMTRLSYARVQVSGAEQYSISCLHLSLAHFGLHCTPFP